MLQNGFRWLEARSGRYSAADPLGIVRIEEIVPLFAYAQGNPVFFSDPTGLDAVTDSPAMLDCFYCLLDGAAHGMLPFERATWIVDFVGPQQEGTLQPYRCDLGAWTRDQHYSRHDGPWPPDVQGIAHTHPTRARDRRSRDEPSENDRAQADRFGIPMYTITPGGIWKYDPATRKTTQERSSNWDDSWRKECPDCTGY